MKKRIVSIIITMVFGVIITFATLSIKNADTKKYNGSEIATESVADTETGDDYQKVSEQNTENAMVSGDTDTENASNNTSGASIDAVNSAGVDNSNVSKDTYETDIMKNNESGIGEDYGVAGNGNLGNNTSNDNQPGNDVSGNKTPDNKKIENNNSEHTTHDDKSDNEAIELPIIPID